MLMMKGPAFLTESPAFLAIASNWAPSVVEIAEVALAMAPALSSVPRSFSLR